MRNLRKKFRRPKKSWNIESIAELNAIKKEYGLKNTRETLIAREMLRGFRVRARHIIAFANEKEKGILIGKLSRMGMLKPDAGLDDVLALGVNNVLGRRLQTMVFKKGMASSIGHARQLIVHGRVAIGGVRTKFPSYLVAADEEQNIGWYRGEPKKSEGPKKAARAAKEGDADPEAAAEEAAKTEAAEETAEQPAEQGG